MLRPTICHHRNPKDINDSGENRTLLNAIAANVRCAMCMLLFAHNGKLSRYVVCSSVNVANAFKAYSATAFVIVRSIN